MNQAICCVFTLSLCIEGHWEFNLRVFLDDRMSQRDRLVFFCLFCFLSKLSDLQEFFIVGNVCGVQNSVSDSVDKDARKGACLKILNGLAETWLTLHVFVSRWENVKLAKQITSVSELFRVSEWLFFLLHPIFEMSFLLYVHPAF